MMPRSSRLALDRTAIAIQRLAKWSMECRTTLGLSQDKAGKGAGISQGGVSRIESGKCTAVPFVSYLALARYYSAVGVLAGAPVTDPGTLLQLPETVGTLGLNATQLALLGLVNNASPRQQRMLLEVVRVLLRCAPEEPDAGGQSV